jgi:hypothetical protein
VTFFTNSSGRPVSTVHLICRRKKSWPRFLRFGTRVTRLGEFSHIGRLLSLVDFFENYRSRPNFWATFVHGKKLLLNFVKKIFGYIFFLKLIWSLCSEPAIHYRFALSLSPEMVLINAEPRIQTEVARWQIFQTKKCQFG